MEMKGAAWFGSQAGNTEHGISKGPMPAVWQERFSYATPQQHVYIYIVYIIIYIYIYLFIYLFIYLLR